MTPREIKKLLENNLTDIELEAVILIAFFKEDYFSLKIFDRYCAENRIPDTVDIVVYLRSKGWKGTEDNLRLLLGYVHQNWSTMEVMTPRKIRKIRDYVKNYYRNNN